MGRLVLVWKFVVSFHFSQPSRREYGLVATSIFPAPATHNTAGEPRSGHLSSMKKLHLGSLRGDPPARARGAKPPPAAIYGSTPESSEGFMVLFNDSLASFFPCNSRAEFRNWKCGSGVKKWAGRYSPIVQGRGLNLFSLLVPTHNRVRKER